MLALGLYLPLQHSARRKGVRVRAAWRGEGSRPRETSRGRSLRKPSAGWARERETAKSGEAAFKAKGNEERPRPVQLSSEDDEAKATDSAAADDASLPSRPLLTPREAHPQGISSPPHCCTRSLSIRCSDLLCSRLLYHLSLFFLSSPLSLSLSPCRTVTCRPSWSTTARVCARLVSQEMVRPQQPPSAINHPPSPVCIQPPSPLPAYLLTRPPVLLRLADAPRAVFPSIVGRPRHKAISQYTPCFPLAVCTV